MVMRKRIVVLRFGGSIVSCAMASAWAVYAYNKVGESVCEVPRMKMKMKMKTRSLKAV